jgi:hypothetical protein
MEALEEHPAMASKEANSVVRSSVCVLNMAQM